MSDKRRTKAELITELKAMRHGAAKLGKSEAKRKQAEEALREGEERYRLLADNVTDVIWTVDMNLRFTYVSPSVERLAGYTAEEAKTLALEDVLAPASLEVARKAFAEELAIEGMEHKDLGRSRTLELEGTSKGGSSVWAEVKMTFLRDQDKQPVGILGVAREITQRKRVEREVLQTKEFYENLVGNAGDAVLSTTSEGVVTSWNRGAESLYGFTEDEALGKDVRDLIVPEDRRGEVTNLINTAAAGQYAIRVETVRLRKDGSPLEVEITNSPIRDSEGNVIGVSGIQKDITERRRLEREVLEAKEYLENLVGSAGDALVGVRTNGTIITWNTGAEELFGFSKDEALGKNIRIIAPDELLADMEEVMARVQSGEVVRNHETVRYRKDGTPVEIDLTNSPIRDAEGRVIGLCGIYKDVSERKRAEREVLKTKEYYENVVGNAGDAIVSLDIAQRVVTWNVGAERLFGYSQSEALGKEFKDLTGGPDKREEVCETVRRSFAGGKVRTYEAQRYKKSGEKVDIAVTATPLRDSEGNVIEFYGILKDITQRKRLEQEVVETKEFLESLIATAGDAIIYADKDAVVTMWNPAAERLYGFTKGEALGKSIFSLHVQDEKKAEVKEIALAGPRNYETVRKRKDGSEVWVSISNAPFTDNLGKHAGVISIQKDITQRKRLEQEVVETKESLENLIATAGDAIICADRDGVITVWNRAAERLYGYSAEEALGKPFASLYVPEEKMEEANELLKVLQQGESTEEYQTQRKRKDGSLVWVSITNAPMLDKGGRHLGNIGIHKDITERKQAESEIRRVSEYYQNLVGSAGDAIIAIDQEFKVTVWNIGAERIFGYSLEEALGQPLPALIGGVDKSDEMVEIGRQVLDGESLGPYEARRYRKDGTCVWVSATLSPLRDSDGEVIGSSVILKEVTEEKRIRQQLMQAEKMVSLGELISGVAHELNNPLTTVIGFSQLSLLQPDLAPKVRINLEKVTSEAERAAHIVDNLLTFARRRKPEKHTVSINSLLRQTLDLRAYQFRVNNIKVVEDFDAQLPDTVADRYQLQQVLLNVVTNAEQAIVEAQGQGTITVRTSQWQDAGRRQWIRAEIRDDGPGIPEEHSSRIFDPFFTTKGEAQGTGLGLSICYGIVREHGGTISVQSELGRGANFIIDLPLARDEAKAPGAEQPLGVSVTSGKNILVVDDEETLLEMFSQILEKWDHRVETALSGQSAVRILEEKDYDLIVTDYKMPRMGGRELYSWLKDSKPHLAGRLLFITGDTVNPETQAFLDETGLPSLAKPFTVSEARGMIEKLLASGNKDVEPRESRKGAGYGSL